MDSTTILIGLASVLVAAAPVVFAVIGETISERAGVINLSMNGTILLSAMAGFAVTVRTESLFLGFLMGMLVGALVALIVAFSSITLKQSQVAVGFVLALVCRDLSYFLGNPFMGLAGPRLPAWSIPGLSEIPVIGTLFFRHDLITYLSFIVIFLSWLWIFRTGYLSIAFTTCSCAPPITTRMSSMPALKNVATTCSITVNFPQGNNIFGCPIRFDWPAARMIAEIIPHAPQVRKSRHAGSSSTLHK